MNEINAHEWTSKKGHRYKVIAGGTCLYGIGGGDPFYGMYVPNDISVEILRLAAENGELRGLLEAVDGLPESAQFPGDAHPVFYIPRNLRDRIRHALAKGGDDDSGTD